MTVRILPDRPLTSGEMSRRYRFTHQTEVKAKSSAYQRAHPEVSRESKKRAYDAAPDAERERKRLQYEADPEPFKARSARWRRENPLKVARQAQRRRARKVAAFVEDVDLAVLVERQGWLCGICGRVMGPRAVSLDHRIALARGGEHSYRNCQAAHLDCNRKKGVR